MTGATGCRAARHTQARVGAAGRPSGDERRQCKTSPTPPGGQTLRPGPLQFCRDALWPALKPLPWWQTLGLLAYAMVVCLLVNDTVKLVLTRWLVPEAVA